MATCKYCGKELMEGARFCMECGAPIEQPFEVNNSNWEFDKTEEQAGWDQNQYTWSEADQRAHAGYQNQQYNQSSYQNQQYNQAGWAPNGQQPYTRDGFGDAQYGQKNRIAAGLLAILLGVFGVHKFYLGYTSTGVIMLLVTVLTFGIGAIVMGVISLVEGILYLTKNDYDFYQTYEVSQKKWF